MDTDKQKQRRKNLLVGWTIGILAVVFYAVSIFYK
jgi:hypothetical protein